MSVHDEKGYLTYAEAREASQRTSELVVGLDLSPMARLRVLQALSPDRIQTEEDREAELDENPYPAIASRLRQGLMRLARSGRQS